MDKKRIHVMSNTHWDREHRHGFQETRLMLVELIDELVEIMENDPEYKYFTFDGQSIPIEDYLDVKPGMRERLTKLIREGRILIGPWYSLLDCNTASGETIVRNLLKGHKYCEAFGGAMKLGYSIFSFGQIAQMPQIYDGFGIDTILFYKNFNREIMPKSEFFWIAPDGTKALATRLGKYHRWNFFFNFSIPVILGGDARIPGWKAEFTDTSRLCHLADEQFFNHYAQELEQDIRIREDKIVDAVRDVLASVDESVSKKVFLGFEGTDFTSPLKDIPEAIRKANELMQGETELIHSNPVDYICELKADIDQSSLISYTGEMRFGPISSIQCEVVASNVELKQAAFKAENSLLYYAEPFASFGSLLGYVYPKEILDTAWKYMFQAYTHDSIHGSGVPKLKPDNAYTLAQAQELSDSVTRRAVENIARQINMEGFDDGEIILTVFNPTPYERSEAVKVQLDLPVEELVNEFRVEELDGNTVEMYCHSKNRFHLPCVNRPNRPKTVYSDRADLDIYVKAVPAYGYKTMKVKRTHGDPNVYQPFTPVGVFPHNPIGRSGNILDNGLLKVEIRPNGSVDIHDRETGIIHQEINVFTDSGCSGSMWAHRMPDSNRIISSKGLGTEIALVRNSSISATYRVMMTMNIPEALDADKKSRSKAFIPTQIITEITLAKDSKRVDFKTSFENRSKDHILTVRIPAGIKAEHSFSECPFEVRKRPIGTKEGRNGAVDDRDHLTRNIMHNFIDISDGENGIAVFSKGLKECSTTMEEDTPVVVLTLLRAVSNTFPIHDDLFVEFEEEASQSIGKQCFEYSVQLHRKDWFEGRVVPASRKYSLPMVTAQIGKGKGGTMDACTSFLELKEQNMTLSGIKKSEDGTGMTVRLFNPHDSVVTETIGLFGQGYSAYYTDMNEQVTREVEKVDENGIHLEAPPYKIITLKIDSTVKRL